MKKLLLGLAVVIAGALGAWFIWNPAPKAPAVAMTTITGEQLSMEGLAGKVVLVKFWATSCVTCIKQMPDTIEYFERYRDRGYETIAVAMDYDPPNYVLNFAQTRQLPFKVVLDTQGEIARAFGNVKLTPTAFLIDRQGRIVKRYLGEYDKTDFYTALESALAG